MRSLNAKRIAAVAAGAAMLGLALGTAFGACPDISKNWVYDANGNPIVQIVVGSNAKISDGIAAANLAAAIASKAYVAGGTKTLTATTHGSVTIQAQGAVNVPTKGVWNDYALNNGTDNSVQSQPISLTLGESQGMYSGTMNYNGTEYNYQEEVDVSGVTVKYYEDQDTHGLFFSVPTEGIKYILKFTGNAPFAGSTAPGKLSNAPEIKFLGKNYVINEVKDNEIVLIQGKKVSIGIGQSTQYTLGNKTYTVTLKDASYDEGTNTGYATVQVSDGTNTYTLNLQTSGGDQDGTAGGLYVFLQGVAKSYTPGVGGTALLRIGGGKLDLTSGSDFGNGWKVKIDRDSDGLHYIEIYSKSVSPNDGETQIVGPNGYFTLKLDGTNIDLGTVNYGKLSVSGTQDTENGVAYDYINSITFTDKNGNQYTFDPYNSDDYRAQLFGGSSTTGIVNVTGGKYLPIRAGDIIAVKGIPVVIDSIYYNTTSDEVPYIKWHMPGGSTVESDLNVNSTVVGGTNTSDIGDYLGAVNSTNTKLYCGTVKMTTNVGTANLNVCIANDGMVNFTDNLGDEPTMWVKGGDITNYLESKYYTIKWDNPTFGTTAYNKGNFSISVVSDASSSDYGTFDVAYMGGYNADYTGIEVTDGNGTVMVNQATKDASDANNMYGMTDYGIVSANGDSATIEIPEKQLEVRADLMPGTASTPTNTTTTNTVTVTTDDKLPYTVANGVTVQDLVCKADPITVNTGYTFGTVPDNLVISDAQTPTAQHIIVIGSYYVNKLAVGHTESLTAAGQQICAFNKDNTTLYAAGYTAQDTMNVVSDLINKIKAL